MAGMGAEVIKVERQKEGDLTTKKLLDKWVRLFIK
jgi:crotonobetainyl-CoA:carnitine CoA-transferase CaiB-like acyl-CoA transferase